MDIGYHSRKYTRSLKYLTNTKLQRAKIQEKRDIYDKYVKEMHWPKISEKKKHELEELKMSIKTKRKTETTKQRNNEKKKQRNNETTKKRNNENVE